MMTEWDLTYILMADTREGILARIDAWNRKSEETKCPGQ